MSAAAFKCTARDLLLWGVALLRELDAIINGDRYFLSPRIQTLRAIRAKLRPEPVREPYGITSRRALAREGGAARVEIPPDRGATDPVANIGLRTTDATLTNYSRNTHLRRGLE